MSRDIGLDVVGYLYDRMQIDAQWSVREKRGFVWWGGTRAQRIWADPPFDENGVTLCRVHARTDFLDRFTDTDRQMARVAELTRQLTLSGLVHDLDDPRRLQLSASVYVHAEVQEGLQEFLAWVAPLQVIEAERMLAVFAGTGEPEPVPDCSDHPTSGARREQDDLLNLSDQIVLPRGQSPSRWRGEDMITVTGLFQQPPCLLATGDEGGVTAEFPFPAGNTSLLRVSTEETHPRLGSGCFLRLTLPHGGDDAQTMRRALEMNEMEEHGDLSGTHFLGSWCAERQGLTFASFLPNALFRRGVVVNLALSAVLRARAVTERLYGHDWDENYGNDLRNYEKNLRANMAALGVNVDD